MAIEPCLNQILALCLQSIAGKLAKQKKANYSLSASCIAPEPDKNWSNLGCRPSLTVDLCPIFVPAPKFGLGTSFYFAAKLQIKLLAIKARVGKIVMLKTEGGKSYEDDV